MCIKRYDIIVTDASNDYILGRISAAACLLSGKWHRGFAIVQPVARPNCRIIHTGAGPIAFYLIKKVIETWYPGLCKFCD